MQLDQSTPQTTRNRRSRYRKVPALLRREAERHDWRSAPTSRRGITQCLLFTVQLAGFASPLSPPGRLAHHSETLPCMS